MNIRLYASCILSESAVIIYFSLYAKREEIFKKYESLSQREKQKVYLILVVYYIINNYFFGSLLHF